MKLPYKQRGVGLIIFFLALILAGSVFLLTHIEPEQGRVVGEAKTSRSLAAAKQALLSYAASFYLLQSNHLGRHGILPCPEIATSASEGSQINMCEGANISSLGRLPWKTLDIQPLKDSAGECLWYAVSGGFKNNPASLMTNDDTPGMFRVFKEDGTLLMGDTAENRVAAVIISPGKPLPGQARPNATANSTCMVTRDVAENAVTNYLDNHRGITNASVDTANEDEIDTFITASGLSDNPGLNDRIITITTDEIFDAIKKSTALYDDKIGALGDALGKCLANYAVAGATTSSNPSTCPGLQGCRIDCQNASQICHAAATTGPEHKQCNDERKACRDQCDADCASSGGSGSTNYHLPWPAPVNLNPQDFREDDSYDDLDQAGVTDPTTGQGYLGRLPNITDDSLLDNPGSDPNIFTTCDLETSSPEMHTLWQHWKDHWFYVVGEEFSPTGTNGSPSCTNCPQLNGGTRYAAILIFSDERTNTQLRRSNKTEDPDPALDDSKADIENYLEGSNFNNYPDGSGNGNYGVNNVNDRLFCIKEDLSDPDPVIECTP